MSRLRGYSEKWLEDRLGAAFTQSGLDNFHMSSPSLPGIPDRYVMGARGLWIEVKQGETFDELMTGFDRQRTFMTKLVRGGDKAFICAYLQPRQDWHHCRLYLEPWVKWVRREQHKEDRLDGAHVIDHPSDVTARLIEFAGGFK